MNPQLEELKQEIPYNNDTDLGDFLSRKGVEEYINRTWNLAMERAATIAEEKHKESCVPIHLVRAFRAHGLRIANAINKEKV